MTEKDSTPDDTYRTLSATSTGLYKEKGSKFLAFAFPVSSEAECKTHLERLRKEYFDARHHCFAYILGPRGETYRANDDGEPSGTAGKPIHGQLLSLGLTNVLVVVVRYFGGIKLGTPGLINAYRTATRDALEHGIVVERVVTTRLEARFDYGDMNDVMRLLKQYGVQPCPPQYAEEGCQLPFEVRLSAVDAIKKAFVPLHRVQLVSVDEPSPSL